MLSAVQNLVNALPLHIYICAIEQICKKLAIGVRFNELRWPQHLYVMKNLRE